MKNFEGPTSYISIPGSVLYHLQGYSKQIERPPRATRFAIRWYWNPFQRRMTKDERGFKRFHPAGNSRRDAIARAIQCIEPQTTTFPPKLRTTVFCCLVRRTYPKQATNQRL